MPLPAQQKLEVLGVRHCYIEYNNAGTLALHRVWFTKKCELKVASTALEFAGDGQKIHRDYGYSLEGTIEASIDDTTLDPILWQQPAVANNGTTDDFSVRFLKGSAAEQAPQFVGIRLSLDADDGDTGAPVVVRYRVLRATFAPDTPDTAQSQTAYSRMLAWKARPALKDISGTALTGVVNNYVYWVKDILTDSTKFDPVPGDVL